MLQYADSKGPAHASQRFKHLLNLVHVYNLDKSASCLGESGLLLLLSRKHARGAAVTC